MRGRTRTNIEEEAKDRQKVLESKKLCERWKKTGRVVSERNVGDKEARKGLKTRERRN